MRCADICAVWQTVSPMQKHISASLITPALSKKAYHHLALYCGNDQLIEAVTQQGVRCVSYQQWLETHSPDVFRLPSLGEPRRQAICTAAMTFIGFSYTTKFLARISFLANQCPLAHTPTLSSNIPT